MHDAKKWVMAHGSEDRQLAHHSLFCKQMTLWVGK